MLMKKILFWILLFANIPLFAQSTLTITVNKNFAFTVFLDNQPYRVEQGENLSLENVQAGIHDFVFVPSTRKYNSLHSKIYIPDGCEIVYLVKYSDNKIKLLPIEVIDFDDNVHYGGAASTDNNTQTNDGSANNIVINVNVVGNQQSVNNANVNTNNNSNANSPDNGSGYDNYADANEVQRACWQPLDSQSFQRALRSIKKQSFSDDKMTVAKQVVSTNCLTTSQIKKILMLFSFEDDKLEFAKYAYGFVYDPENYYQVYDVFDFSSSVDSLKKYISEY